METIHVLQLTAILPELIVLFVAMTGLLVSAWWGNRASRLVIDISIGALFAACVVHWGILPAEGKMFHGMLIENRFTQGIKLLILFSSVVVLWMLRSQDQQDIHYRLCEYPVLLLFSVVGMMLMVSANHFLALYMGLELQSLSLYVLATLHRHHVRSSEAGLKYFVLGSLASGLLLFGCSFIYGFSGTLNFDMLYRLLLQDEHLTIGIIIGLVFVVIGLCFKISAVPFHMWVPDVYQGAPTVVTAFFATAAKVAGVAVLIRVLQGAFGNAGSQWQHMILILSLFSMIVGALGAIRQFNIKRLLAYSAIGHVGYILLGMVAGDITGLQAVMVYMTIYITMTLGVFAVVMMMRTQEGEHVDISMFAGLSKSRPLLAAAMAVLLLSMAGIPPMAGFIGKFYIFKAAMNKGLYVAAVIGVLTSVISAFYYLRVIKIMYFDEAREPYQGIKQPGLQMVAYSMAAFNLVCLVYFAPLAAIGMSIVRTLFIHI